MFENLTCVILAGGLGTRLASVVNDLPKPMAQVAGRPFLEYLLAQVRAVGCTDVVLCIGHKGHVIEDYFGDGRKHDICLRYSREQQLLGTAGALVLARPLIRSDPFFVLNGDSYCPVDMQALWTQHRATSALATIAATRVIDPSAYGQMVLTSEDAIVRFWEKGPIDGVGYVNAGIYLLQLAVLDLAPPDAPCSIERYIFPLLARQGLYAFRQVQSFIDIGTPASLASAQIYPFVSRSLASGLSL